MFCIIYTSFIIVYVEQKVNLKNSQIYQYIRAVILEFPQKK